MKNKIFGRKEGYATCVSSALEKGINIMLVRNTCENKREKGTLRRKTVKWLSHPCGLLYLFLKLFCLYIISKTYWKWNISEQNILLSDLKRKRAGVWNRPEGVRNMMLKRLDKVLGMTEGDKAEKSCENWGNSILKAKLKYVN